METMIAARELAKTATDTTMDTSIASPMPATATCQSNPSHHVVTDVADSTCLDNDLRKQPRASFLMRWLTTLTVIGCVIGVVSGVLCHVLDAPDKLVEVIGFPGQLFIRSLKVMVVPMIFCSMVVSTSSMGSGDDSNAMGRMAIKFYLGTTFVAALEGILLFNLFQFAFHQSADVMEEAHKIDATEVGQQVGNVGQPTIIDGLMKFGNDLVPDNLADAFVKTQLLGIITFAIFFGYVLRSLPNANVVIHFLGTCNETFVEMIRKIIYLTPIGVGSLVAGSVAKAEDVSSIVNNLSVLLIVVVAGQLFHVFGFYSTLYLLFTKKNPFNFFCGLPRAWMTAFGTSSSAATLNTTIKCCEDLGVSKDAIQFILPIGCTINMDGSALERPIVVLWIAFVAGQPIPVSEQLMVALTSALLSIGGSPIPSAGVSTLVVMLESARVTMTPTVQMLAALCLAVEWLLDSIRTTVNVTGDSVGVAIIDHSLKQNLKEASSGIPATMV